MATPTHMEVRPLQEQNLSEGGLCVLACCLGGYCAGGVAGRFGQPLARPRRGDPVTRSSGFFLRSVAARGRFDERK